jgi:hypothetical protein
MHGNVYDMSDWLHKNINSKAASWYKKFLSLFLKDAILFENFMTSKYDIELTKKVVLPAILEIEQETGLRPIIVALEPTDIEGNEFWMSYPSR